MFFLRNPEAQALHLAIRTPARELQLELDVAVFVDFREGVIKRPLLEIRPSFKRRFLNDFSRAIADVFQPQNFAQCRQTYSLVSNRHVPLRPLVKTTGVLAFQTDVGLVQALFQRTPDSLIIAIESDLDFLFFPALDVGD